MKRHDDPHPLMVFIMQFATGKTNHGVKLYGRVARHVNVSNCPVGSIAFYLFYRFEVTKEMDDPGIDFFDNSTWFDIKFITDIRCHDRTKILENKTYSTAIDRTCKALGIATNSRMHIGRKLGSFESEINEDNSDDLRNLGNWDPKTQEKHYSTKLPMGIIRRKAGLMKANHMNYNPRTAYAVPPVLLHAVFPWVTTAMQRFRSDSEVDMCFANKHKTARAFLSMMDEMRSVVIQDAAVMLLEFPDRAHHGLFQLPVFQSQAFAEYTNGMKRHLEQSQA